MATFNDLWQLLYDHGSSNAYKLACNNLWNELSPERRQRLYDKIARKLQLGKFVHFNPLDAMHDNMPPARAEHKHILSYNEYYSTFRTTNPVNGWQMQKGADGKVFYSKTEQHM